MSRTMIHPIYMLILIALLAMAAVRCLPPMLIAIAQASAGTGVTLNSHASRHGEAQDIRDCLDKNGPAMIYKARSHSTWYLVCQIERDWWGLQAVSKDGNEKTAFSPGDGSWRAVKDYLDDIATRFTKPLPWLH